MGTHVSTDSLFQNKQVEYSQTSGTLRKVIFRKRNLIIL